jgi:NAD(P)-dependent dehydrogenase (short-subunit alcohol dehydrogenase family)
MTTADSSVRLAIVTGANRGIGFEVTRQLAREGFTVILGSRDVEKGRAAAEELERAGLKVLPRQLDVTDQESIDRLVAEVEREFKRLDVLVNNAGALYDMWQRPTNADMNTVREAMETNAFGAWRMCQAFIPLMLREGFGRIVNVSSESGSLETMNGETPAYSVSKAAMNAVTRIFAGELKGKGILINSVCPGWVATEMGGPGAPRTVEEGAAGIVWAATLSQDGPTGGFFRDARPLQW